MTLPSYYNDNDAHACQWLRNLIDAGHLPAGTVDARSIADVTPADLAGHAWVNFFAGIGGWPYALRLAGWPATRPVWTASCPCQPFSQAGQRRGTADERHLWPVLFQFIRECKPATLFVEQVASGDGRAWLTGVFADLETMGYAVAGADLCAASVGAPHIRQRLYGVATLTGASADDEMADADRAGQSADCRSVWSQRWNNARRFCATGRMGDASLNGDRAQHWKSSQDVEQQEQTRGSSLSGRLGDAEQPRCEGCGACLRARSSDGGGGEPLTAPGATGRPGHAVCDRTEWTGGEECKSDAASAPGFWDEYTLIPCLDGKARRIESRLEPLVDGLSFRMDAGGALAGKSRSKLLKGYGNAIVPQVAAAFIRAFLATEAS